MDKKLLTCIELIKHKGMCVGVSCSLCPFCGTGECPANIDSTDECEALVASARTYVKENI